MKSEKRVFALGFFDGVHMGHQALLSACREMAQQLHCTAAAITFDAHPQSLFSDHPPALLSTCADRLALMSACGVSHIHCFPVIKDVMSTPWQDFLEILLQEGAAGFVCGDDFHFGHRGEGNARTLRSFCEARSIPFRLIPEQTLKGRRISSTLIRSLIEGGEMETACAFLGHPHRLTATVCHGRKLGRTLGVPTANLTIPHGVVIPKFGVYACRVQIGPASYPAVANVGIRPTVSGSGITVEPWILDFDGDLYGKELQLEFFRFLRPETKFADLQGLQQQIRQDAAETRRYFETI